MSQTHDNTEPAMTNIYPNNQDCGQRCRLGITILFRFSCGILAPTYPLNLWPRAVDFMKETVS
ncbi:hypothetical protein DL89DRAFT_267408 [Linderina pennispora]|uniref:Uncharacterized protein n=1 Tax=Linderina pennispora TaxID=61395 RepID=A0A1Y1WAC8_9FUNG|nr:uncharacterized protein DL89DRAFT_267408 [Linderina pennispora]ORX70186.1 hypothetical protein DL89DRAFT_267408 [Linderina pennispora]